MHENKEEAIAAANKEATKAVEWIEAVPDKMLIISGGHVHASIYSCCVCVNVDSVKGMMGVLHDLRAEYGDYKQDTYWIPYGQMVCATYTVDGISVRFSITTDDEAAVIAVLSNGKCAIETKEEKVVVCSMS